MLQYVVKKPFEYHDGEHFAPGDVFTPTGARNDENIIKWFCRAERVPEDPRQKKERPPHAKHALST